MWLDKSFQRKYLDNISYKFKLTTNDWISRGRQILINNGGDTLLSTCYRGSLINLLSSVYPGIVCNCTLIFEKHLGKVNGKENLEVLISIGKKLKIKEYF